MTSHESAAWLYGLRFQITRVAQTEAAGQVRRFPVPRKAAAPVRASIMSPGACKSRSAGHGRRATTLAGSRWRTTYEGNEPHAPANALVRNWIRGADSDHRTLTGSPST